MNGGGWVIIIIIIRIGMKIQTSRISEIKKIYIKENGG